MNGGKQGPLSLCIIIQRPDHHPSQPFIEDVLGLRLDRRESVIPDRIPRLIRVFRPRIFGHDFRIGICFIAESSTEPVAVEGDPQHRLGFRQAVMEAYKRRASVTEAVLGSGCIFGMLSPQSKLKARLRACPDLSAILV